MKRHNKRAQEVKTGMLVFGLSFLLLIFIKKGILRGSSYSIKIRKERAQ